MRVIKRHGCVTWQGDIDTQRLNELENRNTNNSGSVIFWRIKMIQLHEEFEEYCLVLFDLCTNSKVHIISLYVLVSCVPLGQNTAWYDRVP